MIYLQILGLKTQKSTSNGTYLIILQKLLSKNHFILSTSFIDKTIFESIKFNEDEVFKGSEDFILWVNCLSMNKKFYYSSKPTIKYQIQNQSSIRSSINLKNMHKIHFYHVSKLIIAKNLNLLLIPYYAFFQMLRTFKYSFNYKTRSKVYLFYRKNIFRYTKYFLKN